MKCLHCNKPFSPDASAEEKTRGWHATCVRRFFGGMGYPEIDWSESALELTAADLAAKGFTVPGVQKKISLGQKPKQTSKATGRRTLPDCLPGFIVKPPAEDLANLPEAEFLAMLLAREAKLKTVPFGLMRLTSDQPRYAYVTKRIDRLFERGDQQLSSLAMEDFAQIGGLLSEDKYRSSYERCAAIIASCSERPGIDLTELFMLLVFSFVIGNSDLHLKNVSLIETAPASGKYVLADAYDLLPVQIVYPDDKDELALTLNGKRRRLKVEDFLMFAEHVGLTRKTAFRLIDRIVKHKHGFLTLVQDSYLPDDKKDRFCALIDERCRVLGGEMT